MICVGVADIGVAATAGGDEQGGAGNHRTDGRFGKDATH
jgi:hypothetical protein